MSRPSTPLKFMGPGFYAIVMGLSGLSLAWHRAVPSMGDQAGAIAWVLGAVATAVFAVLAGATLLRGQRYPEAWAEDRRHPVRHTFIATLPIAILLLATVAVALFGPNEPARILWWVGSLSQVFVTAWVLSRWWRPQQAGGLQWASVTPALFIPVVGNVLAPLAGAPLGHTEWAAAQFGIGLVFWPVVLVLLMARILVNGFWPERLMPTQFILIAPPAVSGLAVLQLGAPVLVGWMLWGVAMFTFLWVATQTLRIAAQAFSPVHWGISFPMAALTALTLRLSTPGTPMAFFGTTLLALTSLVILGLVLATVKSLRAGTLLAPEPVASIQPVAVAS
jgi:tellurite resistance protein